MAPTHGNPAGAILLRGKVHVVSEPRTSARGPGGLVGFWAHGLTPVARIYRWDRKPPGRGRRAGSSTRWQATQLAAPSVPCSLFPSP